MRVAMLVNWLMQSAPAARPPRDIARFGIGFCPGCRRLRGVASVCCAYCGSLADVKAEDV
jgi:hypothetical protein